MHVEGCGGGGGARRRRGASASLARREALAGHLVLVLVVLADASLEGGGAVGEAVGELRRLLCARIASRSLGDGNLGGVGFVEQFNDVWVDQLLAGVALVGAARTLTALRSREAGVAGGGVYEESVAPRRRGGHAST